MEPTFPSRLCLLLFPRFTPQIGALETPPIYPHVDLHQRKKKKEKEKRKRKRKKKKEKGG